MLVKITITKSLYFRYYKNDFFNQTFIQIIIIIIIISHL